MSEGGPNILHVILDQLSPHFLPNYGHPVVDTPHIAGLSSNATTFDSAYTNSPLCVPARASLVTGKLPSSVDVYDTGSELAARIPTLAHYLRAFGYHTCLSGKAHFIGPDQLHGFEDRITTEMCQSDFAMSGNWDSGEEPLPYYHTLENVMSAGIAERAAQQDHDEEATHRAKQWLYDWARLPDDERRPFYLMYSLSQPHDPYVTPSRYWNRYDHGEIDLPELPYVPPEDRDAFSAWLYRHYDRGEHAVTDDYVRIARHAYYGNISYVDDLIGEVLATLERIGVSGNTVIVFCSDHGEMLGERGQWFKMSPFEQSARVPLVVRMPGQRETRRVTRNVSVMDLAPTILDLASDGQAVRRAAEVDPMEGHSMRGLLEGDDPDWPDTAVSELMFEGRTEPAVMVRREKYKYVHVSSDSVLLFDMEVDPYERNNLAGVRDYAQVEAEFESFVRRGWDFERIADFIVRDQRRRNFVQSTHGIGKWVSWDFQPFTDATRMYYRSHMSWHEAEARQMLRPQGGTATR